MIRLVLLVLLLIALMQGFAQSPYSPYNPPKKTPQYPLPNQFEHLSVNDGLSNNTVNCILQDRNGFMWFGTSAGLNKYDGSTFTVFKSNPNQPSRSFQNGNISGLCEGEQNQVWAITEGGGLHEINTQTGTVIPHPIRASKASQWSKQISICKDSRGILWISTFAGLARYEPARHHFTLYPAPGPENQVFTALEDRQHRFWVGTLRGMYLLNRSTGQFTLIPVSGVTGGQPYILSLYQDSQDRLWVGTATEGYSVLRLNLRQQPWRLAPFNPGRQLNPYIWRNTIHQDSTGIMWIGTTNGLQAIDLTTETVITYRTDPGLLKGLASNNAQVVYHDRNGMIWVGTDNGIDRQAINTKPFRTYRVKPNERMAAVPENKVNALVKDGRGGLWFTNSTTVYRLSATGKQLATIPPEQVGSTKQHINTVNALYADGSTDVWFGTTDGLYHFDQKTGQYAGYPCTIPVQFISVHQLNRKPTDILWIGGQGGIASFNPVTHQYTYYPYIEGKVNGLTSTYINGLLADRMGQVWVLFSQMGLCRFNHQTGQFVRHQAGSRGGLSSNDVQSIYEDNFGVIWVGTHEGGLNRFDPETRMFTVTSHQDGIPGNTIVGITGDKSGRLWLSTDKGLCRYDTSSRAIHSYELTDGLPSNEFLQNAVFRQPNQLFFGSQNGIVSFDPEQIHDNTRPFPVRITELTVLDKPRVLTDSVVRLTHDENRVSVGFAGLSYEQPGQNQYAYQLVGINPNWVQTGNRHVATFTSLPPGTYKFRVKAANSNGFWTPNEAAIQLIILPPWWATWWAYGFYALLAGGSILGFIRFYTNRIRQQQELVLNRREAEQLKAVDELKTRFFSNITHEFRTPLSLIVAPVEKLLHENRFDRPLLITVQRNADQLLRLINQLLDLSKLESHYMAVSLVQGNVADFIGQTVAVFQRLAAQNGITLSCIITDFPMREQVFDADKWEKILTNLLANALKFTPLGGQVTVTVIPVLVAGEMASVHIELTDSGIGIAPEHLPHIFDRFYQADTSSTRAYEGTGIGLALVNELVGLLGGTIAVESALGAGTTFRLMLPVLPVLVADNIPRISQATLRRAVPETVDVSAGDASRFGLPLDSLVPAPVNGHSVEEQAIPRILIVEDNDELRAFLAGELAARYTVFQAADGAAGWAIAQAELPDIVLTDVMMPGMDGYELTRRIKENPDTDHIAVVMLTAKTAQPSRIEGLQRGADDYLTKPFSVAELQLRLHNLISRQQKLGERYRQQFALPTPDVIINPGVDSPRDDSPGAVGVPMDSPGVDSPDPFLRRIYELLDTHLDNPAINVDWLADQLAMSRKTLYRKVQSLIQLPPTDLIRQYRLRRAAELLRAGHTVSETADLAGFNTPSYFSLVFKEFYQQTPTEFVAGRTENGYS